ncbi:hypothetical protein CR203_15155 [Salipaludibacillus neizhouensis]|uniref:Uncharacterized protein n=1 Tax=Salipaludibacillus neizhouensis TaxID=885475 RepID=A0A3A9K6X9_9BACI|nr:hypothetical protein [Salipaludibacillus neizhouensis]RKL66620.1 hypothetical protein CR203_15155 [Salipaludibacillus neizhouensis]
MNQNVTLQEIAENISKPLLNASDKELEGFRQIIEETIKIRDSHINLKKMVNNYASSKIQRS